MLKKKEVYVAERGWSITVYIIVASLLCIYILRLLADRNQIYIIPDEFSYWAIAAKYSGYDWKGMLRDCPYYSMGYSLFLVPLFHFGVSASTMYKCAIILNVVFIIISYFISLYLGKKLIKDLSDIELAFMCGIIECLPFITMYSNYTWTESLLYFLFWVETLFIYLFVKSNRVSHAFTAVLVSVFMFFVHQRTIGVMIATFSVVALLIILRNSKDFKFILCCLIPFIICVCFMFYSFMLLKKYNLEQVFVGDEATVAINDFPSRVLQLKAVFSIKGLSNLLYSFIGKYFYFCTSTFLIGPYILFVLVKQIVKNFDLKSWEKERFFLLFLLLSFGAMILISAIATNSEYSSNKVITRIDNVFYGRYFEFVLGPFMLLGVGNIKKIRQKFSLVFIIIISYLVIAIVTQSVVDRLESINQVDFTAPGFNYFFWTTKNYENIIFHGALLVTVVFLAIIFFINLDCKISFWGSLCVILAMCTLETYNNDKIIKQREIGNEKYIYSTVDYLFENLTDEKLVYVSLANKADVYSRYAFYIQFNLYDKHMEREIISNFEDIEIVENIIYLVMNDYDLYKYFDQNFEVIYSNERVGLFRKIRGQ